MKAPSKSGIYTGDIHLSTKTKGLLATVEALYSKLICQINLGVPTDPVDMSKFINLFATIRNTLGKGLLAAPPPFLSVPSNALTMTAEYGHIAFKVKRSRVKAHPLLERMCDFVDIMSSPNELFVSVLPEGCLTLYYTDDARICIYVPQLHKAMLETDVKRCQMAAKYLEKLGVHIETVKMAKPFRGVLYM